MDTRVLIQCHWGGWELPMAHLGLLQNLRSGNAVFWELPMAHRGPL